MSSRVFGSLEWTQQGPNALSAVLTDWNFACCGDPISLYFYFHSPLPPPCRQQWAIITKLLFSLLTPVTTLHSSPASLFLSTLSLCLSLFVLFPLLSSLSRARPSLSTSSSLFIVKLSYYKLPSKEDDCERENDEDREMEVVMVVRSGGGGVGKFWNVK